MALIGFLKIPDIAGESLRVGHENEIDIHGVEWGVERNGVRRGIRRTRGRSVVDPLQVAKFYDAASPYLALAVHQGSAFDEIVLSIRKDSGETHLDYLTLTLTNCQITDYEMAHIDGETADDQIEESVEIIYEKVVVNYTRQGDDGSAAGEHEVEIDTIA